MSGLKDQYYGDTLVADFPPYQHHSDTSFEAARSIARHIGPLHKKILDYLSAHDGATDEQLIDALQINPSTLRPRRIELVEQGLLIDSKRYAITRSGRRATLWIRKPEQTASAMQPPLF